MTKLFIDYILPVAIILFCISLGVIGYRIESLKRQITDLRIRDAIHRREDVVRHQLLLDQLRQQKDKIGTMDNLQQVFGNKIERLRQQYPDLTELDIQVLTLIGLGVDNTDILLFTDMSKRTYYKRRQLIAKRMNTTAAQLDAAAKEIFTPKL